MSDSFIDDKIRKKLECILPQNKVKFKDNIHINGSVCEYSDFTKVAFKDGVFYPKFLFKDSFDYELDILPLLCIGLSEVALHEASRGKSHIDKLEEMICNYIIDYKFENSTLDFVIPKFKEFDTDDMSINKALTMSLRTGYSTFGSERAKVLAQNLYLLGIIKPRDFAKLFFDFSVIYMTTMIGYFPSLNLGILSKSEISGKLDLKHYRYKTPTGFTRYLTNCRGLGIAVLNRFIMTVSVNGYNADKFFVDDIIEGNLKDIESSLGNDIVSRIFRNKLNDYKNIANTPAGYKVFFTNKVYEKNGFTLPQEIFEEEFLFKKAYRISSFKKGTDISYDAKDINMHYFSYNDLINRLFYMFGYNKAFKEEDKVSSEEAESLKSKLEESNITVSTLSRKVQELERNQGIELDSLKESYEATINDLKFQLKNKNNLIDSLYLKNNELKESLSQVYSNDELTTTLESCTENLEDIEEKIEAAKEFDILVVGGKNGFDIKLRDLGWTNITQVNSPANPVFLSKTNFDFIVIMTKFVSHHLVKKVDAMYSDYKDRTVYFNSVNVDLFAQSTACFIDSYLNSDN